MEKVGFFRSIHLKFVIIYVLLILVAMQIIGVYFVRQLESTLQENFKDAIQERVNLLSYYVEEQMTKVRLPDEETPSQEEDIRRLLSDYNSADISEVRVVDESLKILGTSDPDNQGVVGGRSTDNLIKMAIATREPVTEDLVEQGQRIWVLVTPIKNNGEVNGAIYLVAKIENIYEQMREINNIFTTGIAIALAITAILGILLAQTVTRPISDMRKQALAMAKGNFSRKVKVYGYDEIGQLAITFNSLTKKLQEAHATTEGERRKLSSVLSYMTDGVIATDRKGRVILINEPAAKMLNVSRETVLSSPIVSLLGLEEDYNFEELLNERDSVILDYSSKSKTLILRANFSVIQKETGFVNGLITVLHDITEQEKIDMERREFVANVSHELRTPLTTMRSYLEALAEGAWRDEEIAPNFLDVTQNETERMIRLVNDLLQLSKMDSKDYRLTKDWTDFIFFYNRIIDRFEMTKQQNVTFERKLPDHSAFVEIDEDKLTQVLDNIISNALKYSPEGGKVTFSIEEKDEFIVVSVSDQGVGIPKENIDQIFERFYRVDKARTRKLGGTGLGLAIAKEMVEAHGGKIWAASTEGKGTTISFSLPYVRSEEDDWE
ncbi:MULTISPECIES: cell wall metabolism sensor histidine kinase WalK [Cytobacillus]|jgi:two-component system, OmpR family, sensor histidine kinase VicK|uniref:histidine kinase n=1 Tax=Cytobacillus oceanisediminis 2691 TaxID=1196031 RepID=A0A160MGW2_9BACI|nr:cell wall metabolism sensor histidine kinase WalK [Cytobacillus oceanisediminis]EFV77936.1 sensor protein [Bacillus sp. 2_A_57_CT2]MBY0157711.1 cell wall metabolism sensor histidine kinase WalK [Cytobacillus firmus]AND42642.1 PAS domain-containing sensor histidine kinase [Cytobacillus oceanisediminis 2691]MCM3391874.1 cell wall metabolism sensor histidine kinase WalK [Cytobacillus oceanisediminis]MCM3528717.1 cell wall metabolism sensor histidine kinase WalK [Cytobacillus oceanisediminis]